MVRIAVLVSGGGTNLQALLDAEADGRLSAGRIELVLSSRPEAGALRRAAARQVPCAVVDRSVLADRDAFDQAVLSELAAHRIDLVVLAGFLPILGPAVVRAFPDRMVNVHPSLLPSFGGPGYYGLRVHEAVLARGVRVTGATVHLVNEVADGGRILLQKAVDVWPDDTPESLQRRVMEEAEWILLPRAVEDLCRGILREKEKERDHR